MFERYHVEVKETLPKFKIPPEFIVRRYNNCTNVQECTQSCVFGVHVIGEDGKIAEPLEELCRGCFRCVIECPDLAISVEANPEFSKLGNTYFTSDRIRTIFFETQTGKVPVSGTGYSGPFAGKGFDGIWFDFSEIVRPTRDGIHGREYVSTSVDLGKKPSRLFFDEVGNLVTNDLNLVEIPIPMILDAPLKITTKNYLPLALAKAATELKTFAIINLVDYTDEINPYALNIIPRMSPEEIEIAEVCIGASRIVEVQVDGYIDAISDYLAKIKEINPTVLVSLSSNYDETSPETAFVMAKSGADIIHFEISDEIIEQDPDLIVNNIRQVHNHLVEKNIRDEVTIIFSGGMAEAAHVPKSIILGADAVGVGMAYQIAVGCKVCNQNYHAEDCPLKIEEPDVEWASQRIVNLIASWRDQLLEVLGGMGLREVRRQRGEMGRMMTYQDLETRIFGGNA